MPVTTSDGCKHLCVYTGCCLTGLTHAAATAAAAARIVAMTTVLNDFIPESVGRRRELYTPHNIKVFSFHAFPFISQVVFLLHAYMSPCASLLRKFQI